MQRRVLLVACLLIIIIQSGCKSVAPRALKPLSTTRQEKKLAESLAHFSQALIYVGQNGEYSTKALREYETALNLAPEESADHFGTGLADHDAPTGTVLDTQAKEAEDDFGFDRSNEK